MGKKHYNLAGLSHFVREAFGQTNSSENASKSELETNHSADTSVHNQGTSRKASERDDLDEDAPIARTNKKRKTGLLGAGHERYDATGLVPYYTDASEVPVHLRKYFFQKERYFSLYSSGCLLDEEGWYSITPELIATQIAERCRCGTVLDAFCGVGGNTIAFAQTCERVIALDTSPTRLALARHNAVIYGVDNRIEFILGDYISFAKAYLSLPNQKRKIDVVFLSPPWGGPEYLSGPSLATKNADEANHTVDKQSEGHPEFTLAQIKPIHGAELFALSRKITKNVAYFLPRNTNLNEISSLLKNESTAEEEQVNGEGEDIQAAEKVEVEEEWMGPKLKALTCYFGGLAAGQEDMFDA